ncbi:MAG: transposase [Betaproteobacteria bacterium]|nr:transposase [Betaproteobacteria bacterium]
MATAGGQTPLAQVFGLMDVTSGLLVHGDLWASSTRTGDVGGQLGACVLMIFAAGPGVSVLLVVCRLIEHQRHFCMRVRDGVAGMAQFAAFFQSRATEAVIQVEMPAAAVRKAAAQGFAIRERRFPVRLIRVCLPSGQEEFLVTSLLDKAAFPASEFAALYHRRWRIEECFKVLKCRLAVEHFSGELPISIRQDFLAKVWLGNLVATFAYLAHAALPPEKQGRFSPNLTYAITAVRAILPRLLLRLAHPDRALRICSC